MGVIRTLKHKWIDGECRHLCVLCEFAFGCRYHADICKKRDKMLNEAYEFGMANMKDHNDSKQYDKGWMDCYELYKGKANEHMIEIIKDKIAK